MLSTATRLRIQRILARLSKGELVSLQERVFINKFASRDQTVSNWLKRAIRIQQGWEANNPIDKLIDGLDLGSSDPNASFNPDQEDLGDWFSGAPSWLGRS